MSSTYIEGLMVGHLFVDIGGLLPNTDVHLKIEGLSLAGSIKIKPAFYMIKKLEKSGVLRRGMRVIESSSGNLGVALSIVCANRGYPFTCVSDPNISPQTARLMQAYGAKVITVDQRDENGGFLGTRIRLIKSMLGKDRNLVWVNQYESEGNVEAHYHSTGPEILHAYPNPDFVFIGAGTTGTLGGVSRYLRERSPSTKIIAVDSVGSITFGGAPGRRHIPGLGTSAAPPIRKHSHYDHLVMVKEEDGIAMCHELAKRGLLLGGSTGTVLSSVTQFMAGHPGKACVVAISPDMGDRYIDTVYDPAWVRQRFPTRQERTEDIRVAV